MAITMRLNLRGIAWISALQNCPFYGIYEVRRLYHQVLSRKDTKNKSTKYSYNRLEAIMKYAVIDIEMCKVPKGYKKFGYK